MNSGIPWRRSTASSRRAEFRIYSEPGNACAPRVLTRFYHCRRQLTAKSIPGSIVSPLFRNLAVWIRWESGVGKEVSSVCQASLCYTILAGRVQNAIFFAGPACPPARPYISASNLRHIHLSPTFATRFAPNPYGWIRPMRIGSWRYINAENAATAFSVHISRISVENPDATVSIMILVEWIGIPRRDHMDHKVGIKPLPRPISTVIRLRHWRTTVRIPADMHPFSVGKVVLFGHKDRLKSALCQALFILL